MHSDPIRDPVAELAMVMVAPGGVTLPVVARVGRPYQTPGGEWACPAELAGVDGRYPDIHGETSLQALALAMRLLRQRLGHLAEGAGDLGTSLDLDGPVDGHLLDCLFGTLAAPASPSADPAWAASLHPAGRA